jgi:NADH dehydrogenase FAD-containing subunit
VITGAVGVEMAAEIKLVYPDQTVTLIHSRDRLLSSEPLPDFFKEKSLAELKETGVEVVLSKRVNEINPVEGSHGRTEYSLALSDGTTLQAGHVISAISKSIPSSSFLPKDALDGEGLVRITPT